MKMVALLSLKVYPFFISQTLQVTLQVHVFFFFYKVDNPVRPTHVLAETVKHLDINKLQQTQIKLLLKSNSLIRVSIQM